MSASGGASQRPALAFAHDPRLTGRVFTNDHFRRLAQCCRIVDAAPLRDLTSPDAAPVLAEAQILLTAWGCGRIDGRVLASAPGLRLVAHAAGTVKSFVMPEVFAAGIAVTNAVAANAEPVAQFTLAAILLANKRVETFRALYRETRADLRTNPLMQSDLGNWRKTIGVVGASHVGRRVVELLRPHAFDVLLYDPFVDPLEADRMGVRLAMLDTLMSSSDVVTLHAPALGATRGMIDARLLARMPDGATLINTARGSLIEQAALEQELVSGRINAVIDVTEPEVLPPSSPIYDLPNVMLTPHIAGAIGIERERLGDLAVSEIERFAAGEPLRHRVAYEALERLA